MMQNMIAAFSESQWLDLHLQFEVRRCKKLQLMDSHESDGIYD
jgi:hypothetical protein